MIYALLSVHEKAEKLNLLLSTIKGISQTDLMAVSYKEIAAVVSCQKETDIIADKNKVLEYAGVIDQLAQHFTLLPMRYGSSMESNEAILAMLKINYTEIHQNLLKVENKNEFGLKIFCDTQKLHTQIRAESEINSSLNNGLEDQPANSVFKDYVNKKLREHRLEELMISYVDALIAEISIYLDQFHAFYKFKKMTTSNNIIDAVFLLDKEKQTELVSAIETLQHRYPDLNVMLTGPWSPFNFVEITIK